MNQSVILRLTDLSVNTKKLKHASIKNINFDILRKVSSILIRFFIKLETYKFFETGSLEYICLISTRYALWNLNHPNTNQELNHTKVYILSLWLSMVWLIDGIFDKNPGIDKKYKYYIINIVRNLGLSPRSPGIQEENREITHARVISDGININTKGINIGSLSKSLLKDVEYIYSIYINEIEYYREKSPEAFTQIEYWFDRYLKTLCESTQDFNLSNYKKFRLDSGAIMCVIWHNILFDNVKNLNQESINFYKEVATTISYHNDILSFNRDLEQKTPNIISILAKDINFKEIKSWNIFEYGIHLVNSYYKQLVSKINELDKYTINNALTILEGSYNWTNSETRYSIGLKMLKHSLNGNLKHHYNIIMNHNEVTLGDPK